LSWSCPASAAIVTGDVAADHVEADLVHHLGITGFTFPGMIEEPGCIAGG
jgi:hypothetical protein